MLFIVVCYFLLIFLKELFYQLEGKHHTVKLPEFKYYLDEGSTFEEQSDYVQKCLKKLYREKKIKAVKDYMDRNTYVARGFYNTLDATVGSPKKASLLLNDYGIAGIRYDGNIDKGCAVIFNNKDITIVSKATNINKDTMIDNIPEKIEECSLSPLKYKVIGGDKISIFLKNCILFLEYFSIKYFYYFFNN